MTNHRTRHVCAGAGRVRGAPTEIWIHLGLESSASANAQIHERFGFGSWLFGGAGLVAGRGAACALLYRAYSV